MALVRCNDDEPAETNIEFTTSRGPPFRYIRNRVVAANLAERFRPKNLEHLYDTFSYRPIFSKHVKKGHYLPRLVETVLNVLLCILLPT